MRLPISTNFLICLINRMIHTFPISKTDSIRFGAGRQETRVGGTLFKKFSIQVFLYFKDSFFLLKCAILQTCFAFGLTDANMELNQERNGKFHHPELW